MMKGKGLIIGENSSDDKWVCSVCTFVNSIESNTCCICGSSRYQREQKK